ncbi:MAG TPA: DinB family protein [Nocardioides sp.]|nr:DinB family protein [Nocardioides sp.]
MTPRDPKATLHTYLRSGREALLWKCEGLSEYDVRRPLVRTGTNLLGLVKHMASVELGYFGETFGRPAGIDLPWFADDAEPNADLWAAAEESREDVLGLYRRAAEHADATIESLDVDATGSVPWWAPGNEVTLHQILVHVATETHRHAGHADIVRELIDGAVGLRPGNDNVWGGEDDRYWDAHRQRLEAAAREAERRHPG